ncbi:class I SAM-dependent methyltransferase [Mesoterricola silvestris]|uniref:Methyltransferase n=1 Tax=Mesoterricola silvestris TaxID=2927979 RepID=A0AA48GK02_9BACT|nr:class I SAM-dependent methyltransferase [Mesoterricola silvestris]BDU72594.1 methyltransferase [Mesoterricola silvestris]
MTEWFRDWFDQDYAAIYAARGPEEAGTAVAMALSRAPGLASGPVLDLACGSGRHLAALRRTNGEAFGLDLSRDLLAMAPEELRPWLLRGDMRRLPIRAGSLSGICMWFTPFGYFSDEQNRALLAALRGLLRPGGVLLLDYLNAAQVRATLVKEDEAVHHGLRVVSRRSLEDKRIVKRMVLTRLETGDTRRVTESVRLYEPCELVAMARECGLELSGEAGDYQGGAFDAASSPRWIGFLRRNEVDWGQ